MCTKEKDKCKCCLIGGSTLESDVMNKEMRGMFFWLEKNPKHT
jgi:hypothetical protein